MHEYLKYLRKSLENQRGKKEKDICEKILGVNTKVNQFASFYEEHEEDLLVFTSATLAKWEAEKEFSSADLAIYRLGLTELAVFMGKCVLERDTKTKESAEKNRQLYGQDHAADGISAV